MRSGVSGTRNPKPDARTPRTIAVIHNAVQRAGRQPFRSRWVGQGPAYWLLIATGRRFGLSFVLTSRAGWNGRSRTARWAWSHDGRRWRRTSMTSFDAILPRTDLKVRRAPPIVYWNAPRLWRVCADKWLTYRRFLRVSPSTWRVATPDAVDRIRARHRTQTFVLKPRFGRQARRIFFLPPGRSTPRRWVEPMLLQSAIPGGAFGRWTRSVVDVRCYVQNGLLVLAYLNVGSPAQPILNVHRGSRLVRRSTRTLPPSARAFVRRIDSAFVDCRPRQYAVDFRYDDRGRPRLVELNHLPVLPGPGPDATRFYRLLCAQIRTELRSADTRKRSRRRYNRVGSSLRNWKPGGWTVMTFPFPTATHY